MKGIQVLINDSWLRQKIKNTVYKLISNALKENKFRYSVENILNIQKGLLYIIE